MSDVRRLPGPVAEIWDWQLQAACRGQDSGVFFHPEGERGAARARRESNAKAWCHVCPVRSECLDQALASREPYGVWGGLGESERADMLRARGQRGVAS